MALVVPVKQQNETGPWPELFGTGRLPILVKEEQVNQRVVCSNWPRLASVRGSQNTT